MGKKGHVFYPKRPWDEMGKDGFLGFYWVGGVGQAEDGELEVSVIG